MFRPISLSPTSLVRLPHLNRAWPSLCLLRQSPYHFALVSRSLYCPLFRPPFAATTGGSFLLPPSRRIPQSFLSRCSRGGLKSSLSGALLAIWLQPDITMESGGAQEKHGLRFHSSIFQPSNLSYFVVLCSGVDTNNLPYVWNAIMVCRKLFAGSEEMDYCYNHTENESRGRHERHRPIFENTVRVRQWQVKVHMYAPFFALWHIQTA